MGRFLHYFRVEISPSKWELDFDVNRDQVFSLPSNFFFGPYFDQLKFWISGRKWPVIIVCVFSRLSDTLLHTFDATELPYWDTNQKIYGSPSTLKVSLSVELSSH